MEQEWKKWQPTWAKGAQVVEKVQALEDDRAYWQWDTTMLLVESNDLLQQLTCGGDQ